LKYVEREGTVMLDRILGKTEIVFPHVILRLTILSVRVCKFYYKPLVL